LSVLIVLVTCLILAGTFVLLLRRPGRFLLSWYETGAVASLLVLGLLQAATRGQVHFDDLLFGPLYLAVPAWIGARRGMGEGTVAAVLALGPLVALAALVAPAAGDEVAGRDVAAAEYAIAGLIMAGVGALAGLMRRVPGLPALVPAVWLLFVAIVDWQTLLGLRPWIVVATGGAWVAGGLVVADLVDRRKVAAADGEAMAEVDHGRAT
jgi:hypothetical protein